MDHDTDGGRSEAYRLLRQSEALHRATLESISDAVFLTDDDGRFTFICPNVDVIFGYAPEEVQALGRIDALLGPALFRAEELAASREIFNIERDVTVQSGARRALVIHVKAVSIMDGTRLYCCRDVTDLKQRDEELQAARLELAHASRLAVLGELMGSLAHELNQPLASIASNAVAGLRQFERELPPADAMADARAILTDIMGLSQRAMGVVARVRALVRKRPLERQPIDVDRFVGDTLRLIEGDARRRQTTLVSRSEPALPSVSGDPIWLQQVLLNLAINAMDAMDQEPPDGRELVVAAQRVDAAVEVAVSDTGHGIPADHLPRLFEAFFTTKREGIGLGLAISRSIVEAHGGRLAAENREGRGATFRMTLPVA